jgi:hypothetical protein
MTTTTTTKKKTHRYREKECDDGSKDQSDVFTSQVILIIAESTMK